MKKLFILIVLLAVGLATVGFQRGWLQLASDGDSKKTNLTLTVDKDKIHEDEARAINKVQHIQDKPVEKVEKTEKHVNVK